MTIFLINPYFTFLKMSMIIYNKYNFKNLFEISIFETLFFWTDSKICFTLWKLF